MGMGSVFMGEAKLNFQENDSVISPTDHVAPHTVTHSGGHCGALLHAVCQSVQKLAWHSQEGKP